MFINNIITSYYDVIKSCGWHFIPTSLESLCWQLMQATAPIEWFNSQSLLKWYRIIHRNVIILILLKTILQLSIVMDTFLLTDTWLIGTRNYLVCIIREDLTSSLVSYICGNGSFNPLYALLAHITEFVIGQYDEISIC